MKAALTGGGTLGHVVPGVAVAKKLEELGHEVFWIGSKSPRERAFVEKRGIRFFAVRSGKLRRYFSLRNLATPFQVVGGYFQALGVLRRERPAVLFSKGGYVSLPVARAARSLGIPIVTHESDSSCGLATKLIARWAAVVCLGDAGAKESLERALRRGKGKKRRGGRGRPKGPETVVTGNPVREDVLGGDGRGFLARHGIAGGLPVVLVLGGSQGALRLSQAVAAGMGELGGLCSVVLQTGRRKKVGGGSPSPAGLWRFESFDSEMGDALAAADIVVSRAGAGAIAEIRAAAKPMILVPMGLDASRGDQISNALAEEKAGRALVAGCGDVVEKIEDLLNNGLLRKSLAGACRLFGKTDGARAVAEQVLRVAGNGFQRC